MQSLKYILKYDQPEHSLLTNMKSERSGHYALYRNHIITHILGLIILYHSNAMSQNA